MTAGKYGPYQILAADETGFHGTKTKTKRERVLTAAGGTDREHSRPSLRSHVSVLHICAATGLTLPPIQVKKALNIQLETSEHAPPGLLTLTQENGYFEAKDFITVLQHIVRHHPPDPAVVPSDQLKSVTYVEHWTTKDSRGKEVSHVKSTTSTVFPRLLIIDNAAVHRHPLAAAYAELHLIEVVYLPPNLTHLMQVSDVAVFGTLKKM